MRTLITGLILSLATPALAGTPALHAQTVAGVSLAVPSGWQSAQTGPTLWMAQEPSSGAALVLTMVPAAQGPASVQQLVMGTLPNARLVASQPQPQGTLLQVYEGQGAAGPSRIALLTGIDASAGIAYIAAFGAPTDRFDQLGGSQLVLAFAAQSGPVPTSGGQAVARPMPSASPVPLKLLAEGFEQMPPAQVAASLRALSPSDATLLTAYPAFANLLHAVGCQADPALPLPTSMGVASCAQTLQQWQNTYQLVGSWDAATSQAFSERSTYLIGAQCGDGSMARQDCQLYMQGLSSYNAMSHETSMRILSNMSPDGCLLGDPGCVAY